MRSYSPSKNQRCRSTGLLKISKSHQAKSADPLKRSSVVGGLVSVLVYLQGSSALGTAVKPIGRREFDVDLICFCAGIASGISPATLKAAVGNRLKEHATYVRLLEEKKG